MTPPVPALELLIAEIFYLGHRLILDVAEVYLVYERAGVGILSSGHSRVPQMLAWA